MCERCDPTDAAEPADGPSTATNPIAASLAAATVIRIEPPKAGSRRRRLWELDTHAHCPVIGVCLPLAALRALAGKALGGEVVAGDYELHCGVVTDCKRRSPIAEAVQRHLDDRHALALRQAATQKDSAALAAWWRACVARNDLPGALWATLTHPRCTPGLTDDVLGDIHMIQHQVGASDRIDRARFDEAIAEAARLRRDADAQQQRAARQAAAKAAQIDAQNAELMRLRARLVARDTAVGQLREELTKLRGTIEALDELETLRRERTGREALVTELRRALAAAQREGERLARRAEQAETRWAAAASTAAGQPTGSVSPAASGAAGASAPTAAHAAPGATPDPPAGPAAPRALLCVGGRPAGVPVYRKMVERAGARFLHHDGGTEDRAARLDASLQAADGVICQSGCVSHDAYWRVKEHCRRAGKPCVFVSVPSHTAMARAIGEAFGALGEAVPA